MLTIRSPAFAEGGEIPRIHTCEGDDVSPALEFKGVPQGDAAGPERLEEDRLRRSLSSHRPAPVLLRPVRPGYGAGRPGQAHPPEARARLRRALVVQGGDDGDLPEGRKVAHEGQGFVRSSISRAADSFAARRASSAFHLAFSAASLVLSASFSSCSARPASRCATR